MNRSTLRVGDLVLYGTLALDLGVFLEEEARGGLNCHRFNVFWNVATCRTARTVVDFDLLVRVPLHGEDR